MKYLSVVVLFLFFSHQSFSQKEKVLYPMNWVGINLSKTLGVNNQIIDFELRRKIYKKNKIEVGVSVNFEYPYYLKRNQSQLLDYNKKFGITPEFNYVLSKKSYVGIGIQFEKYKRRDRFFVNPKITSGLVINKKLHLILEVFAEYNKVFQYPMDVDPAGWPPDILNGLSYKTTVGIGIKKSIFHPKAKWRTHKRRKGVIRTL